MAKLKVEIIDDDEVLITYYDLKDEFGFEVADVTVRVQSYADTDSFQLGVGIDADSEIIASMKTVSDIVLTFSDIPNPFEEEEEEEEEENECDCSPDGEHCVCVSDYCCYCGFFVEPTCEQEGHCCQSDTHPCCNCGAYALKEDMEECTHCSDFPDDVCCFCGKKDDPYA